MAVQSWCGLRHRCAPGSQQLLFRSARTHQLLLARAHVVSSARPMSEEWLYSFGVDATQASTPGVAPRGRKRSTRALALYLAGALCGIAVSVLLAFALIAGNVFSGHSDAARNGQPVSAVASLPEGKSGLGAL